MRFSVIIPVYNVEDYLEECLASILNQTCRNYEIVLIDDGSTDRSGAICDSYARQYPEQIKVYHQKNQGLLKTRVIGLSAAEGEIIVFVDSDDALRLDALEKIDGVFEKTDCEMVIYDISRDAGFIGEYHPLKVEDGHCFAGTGKRMLYELMTKTAGLNQVCRKAAKKEVYNRFLGSYNADVEIANGEDLYLSMPLVTHAEKIVALREKLYFYRFREGSMVNSFSPTLHRSVKAVRMEMEKYMEIWGVQDCYPVLYRGVVRNWVHATRNLLKSPQSRNKAASMPILRELSEDAFFRKAYENMTMEEVSLQDRWIAGWLYRGKLWELRAAGAVFHWVKKCKFKN